MAVSLTVLGSRDAQLEELVRASGQISTRDLAVGSAARCSDPRAAQPDVLLVDVRRSGQLPSTLAALKRQHPATNVMLLASALDPALMLEGMRAGVTEVLAEPLRQADFDAAMTRLLGQRKQVAGGPVFAFVGAKGGVGTTTTAVNVATVLAKLSKGPALLVDLHLAYGDAAVFLGADARFSLLDALENMHRLDAEFLKSLVVKTSSGLELLASADRPANRRGRHAAARLGRAARRVSVRLHRPGRAALRPDGARQSRSGGELVVVANQELATVRNAGRMAAALRARYPNTARSRRSSTAPTAGRDRPAGRREGGRRHHRAPVSQ